MDLLLLLASFPYQVGFPLSTSLCPGRPLAARQLRGGLRRCSLSTSSLGGLSFFFQFAVFGLSGLHNCLPVFPHGQTSAVCSLWSFPPILPLSLFLWWQRLQCDQASFSQGKPQHFHLSWPLVTATVSIPYSVAGRIIVLYILPFTAAGTILSHMIPVTFLHARHHAWILFATSFSVPSSICTVDPRYLKSSTLLSWLPSMCTWSSWLPRHRYSVFSLLTLIPLSSIAFLQFSSRLSTSSQVSPHSTTSSAKSMSHGASHCSGPVRQSITMAIRSGLKAKPWWRQTLTSKSSVTPVTVQTLVRLP